MSQQTDSHENAEISAVFTISDLLWCLRKESKNGLVRITMRKQQADAAKDEDAIDCWAKPDLGTIKRPEIRLVLDSVWNMDQGRPEGVGPEQVTRVLAPISLSSKDIKLKRLPAQ